MICVSIDLSCFLVRLVIFFNWDPACLEAREVPPAPASPAMVTAGFRGGRGLSPHRTALLQGPTKGYEETRRTHQKM